MRHHPALVYGVLGAALWAIAAATGVEYDEGGIGSALWLVAQLFSLPYWLVREGIFAFAPEGIPFQTPIVVVVGLALCALTDAVLRRARSKA